MFTLQCSWLQVSAVYLIGYTFKRFQYISMNGIASLDDQQGPCSIITSPDQFQEASSLPDNNEVVLNFIHKETSFLITYEGLYILPLVEGLIRCIR
jgi:hypothetical protein